jgi:hypothetical protein
MSLPSQPSFESSSADWLVFGDALQESGDPRGELIALHHAKGSSDDVAKYVDSNASVLLGDVAKHIDRMRLHWHWCFLEAAEVRLDANVDGVAIVTNLLQSDIAKELRSLTLVGCTGFGIRNAQAHISYNNEDGRLDLAPVIAAACANLPATCSTLRLVDERATETNELASRDYSPGRNLVDFGNLEVLWSTPALRHLELKVADPHQLQLGTINAPHLKSFKLHGLHYGQSYLETSSMLSDTLAEATWDALEEFDLQIPETWTAGKPDTSGAYVDVYGALESDDDDEDDYDDYYDDYGDDEGENHGTDWSAELAGLLTSLKKLSLTRLALTHFDSSKSLLKVISDSGLPETLKTLDLSNSSISKRDIKTLLKMKPVFANLQRLDLRKTTIKSADKKQLDDLVPEVLHSEGGLTYRYVVGME